MSQINLTPEEIERRIARSREKKNRYLQHGVPSPVPREGLSEELLKEIDITTSNTTAMVIKYLRGAPILAKNNMPNAVHQYNYTRSKPFGVLVAFATDAGVMVGWSKRHDKLEKNIFTKHDALRCAVTRAYTDSIRFSKSESAAFTNTGEVIPAVVSRELKTFLNRVHLAFNGAKLANVSFG